MTSSPKLRKKPVVLLIFDGFGVREEKKDNAILEEGMPNYFSYVDKYAFGTIDASERMVGLPTGQFGNSEVGHLNIGAGRVVEQDITRIDVSIENDTLKDIPVMRELLSDKKRALHVMGLLSDGGVHSHINHFWAVLKAAVDAGLEKIVVHPFLDGRDTPPKSAEAYLKKLDAFAKDHPKVKVGIVAGRFFAMDRDNRWERVSKVYDALVTGKAEHTAATSLEALEKAYARDEMDEFVEVTNVGGDDSIIRDGDAVIFMNFRADRARELTKALTFDDFDGFERCRVPKNLFYVSMTEYGAQFKNPSLFPPKEIRNGLGEYVSSLGLRQLRIAETEKYPHVTYFLSGGREEKYPGEERILIPSPKVKTYDMQPEMSALPVAEAIVDAVENDRFDLVLCNFANGDMVGHTGDLEAAKKAVGTLDKCLKMIVDAVLAKGGEVVVTADHGNCEQMYDYEHNQIHTQHTTNPVPFLYIGDKATIKKGGALKDIAPTLLALLGLDKPEEMTGFNLVEWS